MVARQTTERRQLGLTIRRLRQDQGYSQLDLANVIDQVDSRITKFEDGTATLNQEQLSAVLDFLEVFGAERDTILELGTRARTRQRRTAAERQPYLDTLPGSFQRMADMEAAATTIYWYEPGIVPGLLQSPGYVRAMIRANDGVLWSPSEIEVENRISYRRQRQIKAIEAAKPKRLEFVFTADALDPGDDPTDEQRAVLRDQAEHLLYLARRYPNLTVQVLGRVGLRNPVPNAGVIVYDFDGGAPRIGFAPSAHGPSLYLDGTDDVAAMLRTFRRVQELAHRHGDSIELIRSTISED